MVADSASPSLPLGTQHTLSFLENPLHLSVKTSSRLRSTLGLQAEQSGMLSLSPAHVCSVTQSCLTLCNPINCKPTRLHCPWDFPGKNTGVDCHFLLQGSSWPRDQTHISCVSTALNPDLHSTWPPEITEEQRLGYQQYLPINCSTDSIFLSNFPTPPPALPFITTYELPVTMKKLP